MGLFDNVVKKGLGDALGGALGSKVTDAIEQATGIDLNKDGQAGSSGSAYGSQAQPVPVPGQQEAQQQASDQHTAFQEAPISQSGMQTTDKAYFRGIINECFSNYIIREDVSVSELGGEGTPYDFMLIANGSCAAVIMLVDKSHNRTKGYKGAEEAAQASGVPLIYFWTRMPNERGFVINRIKRLAKPA